MSSLQVSSNFFLNKSTYSKLRWIGIIGQFLTINIVAFVLKFEFNFLISNLIVFFGVLSNLFLNYFHK